MEQIGNRDRLIKSWLYEAAAILRDSFHEELEIDEKTSRTDLVTNMDREIEVFLYEKITNHFPGERILGEESIGHDLKDLSGVVWIIDPIDGTLNFIKQQAEFAIMIGVYEDGIGRLGYIYDVVRDELYFAIRDNGAFCNERRLPMVENKPLSEGLVAISNRLVMADAGEARRIARKSSGLRVNGSAGLETAWVASGKLIAYIAPSLAPWDVAAGLVIAEEVGLVYRQVTGEKVNLLGNNAIIVANEHAFREISETMRMGE
ncbi:inositol monophosphatase family protein [Trichococcus ilyis]|jgi:myo-inositol-1(or 4)-monophosphatase|uniref:Inositol monophosphatase n=1 Tax=Trichococcus ilyis TaxID=640938 RepID=A0A143Z3R1_9LACT|nr:inositol monophosphatase family protein [Trichococcus ilyis]CZR04798.1 inositol monophosphatase [Trichococcus ilyis]SEJ45778.1 myo-inositol-1(or 4)-monophosphatase [Trichococcus ilyis]